jgi:membrane fusion protein (multidrug efflux system)
VVAIPAAVRPVTESLSLVGTVAPNEFVELKAETDGIVESIHFNEGQRVKAGDLLVQLEQSKFSIAVAEAEATLKLSQANHERAKQLFADKLISQQEYDQTASIFAVNQASLDLKKRQLKDTQIYAPFAGITGARQISPGQVISRQAILTWLVDLDTVKVEVNVPERYLSQVTPGLKIGFSVASFPNDRFEGEVYFVSPQLNPETRTALIKARIPNPDHRLRGGMFASLALTLQLRAAAIVVPEPALMSNGDNVMVFVMDENQTAQMRPVKVGLRLAGKAEITSGLKEGEMVIVEGVQKLYPGAAVQQGPPESLAPYLDRPAGVPAS